MRMKENLPLTTWEVWTFITRLHIRHVVGQTIQCFTKSIRLFFSSLGSMRVWYSVCSSIADWWSYTIKRLWKKEKKIYRKKLQKEASMQRSENARDLLYCLDCSLLKIDMALVQGYSVCFWIWKTIRCIVCSFYPLPEYCTLINTGRMNSNTYL